MWEETLPKEKKTGLYRCHESLSNFRVKVVLKKIKAIALQDESEETKQGPEIELQGIRSQDDSVESRTFTWQEKVFCTEELELYRLESNCLMHQEKMYHQQITTQDLPSPHWLFSLIDADINAEKWKDEESLFLGPQPSNISPSSQLSESKNMNNFLRHQLYKKSFPKTGVAETSATVQHRFLETPVQQMYIMADLADRSMPQTVISDPVLLCKITVDANGLIQIAPDISAEPYTVTSRSGNKFEYTLELTPNKKSYSSIQREQQFKAEIYQKQQQVVKSLVGSTFDMPHPQSFLLTLYGEIVAAKNFETRNIHVYYYLHLPEGWEAVQEDKTLGVSHTTTLKNGDGEIGFPFEIQLSYHISENGDVPAKWPLLFLQAVAVDFWDCISTQGYGFCILPNTSGLKSKTVEMWKPAAQTQQEKLRNFFLGSDMLLEDPLYPIIPSEHEGPLLSKLGFQAETSGSIQLKLNIVHQSHAPVQKVQHLDNVLSRLRSRPMQTSIAAILAAYQRARSRMIQVRSSTGIKLDS